MERVTRFLCQYCRKLFKRDKHFCFKDPANRACASCKGWHGYKVSNHRDEDGELQESAVCGITEKTIHIKYEWQHPHMSNVKWNGNRFYDCPDWQPSEYVKTHILKEK